MNYTAFLLQNPWRKGEIPIDRSTPREIFPALLRDLDSKAITVIIGNRQVGKTIELKEIYDSYIRKDVKDYLNIDNISGYNNLVKGLAQQSGNLVNYNELSLLTGLNGSTVKKYIDYLEGTYIFKRIYPSFSNARKEISRAPKIYTHDKEGR